MKRLTDTAKWKNPWFRNLPLKFKLLFLYILDECDNAGVMHLDFELISFSLKEHFSLDEFSQYLGEKVHFLATDKIIIRNFVTYQQNDNNALMLKHVDKLLRSHKILEDYKSGKFN